MRTDIIFQIFKYVNEDGTVDVNGLLQWLEDNKFGKKEDRELRFDNGDISRTVVYEGDGWEISLHYVVGKDGTLKLGTLDIS
jgi:hypothetical protein